MNWSNDFRQWPLGVKLTMPLWLPVFLLLAVVFYTAFSLLHALGWAIDDAERRMPK